MATMTDTTAADTTTAATPAAPATAAPAPRRRRSPEQKRREDAAFHEAGHAVVAWHHGIAIEWLSLDPPEIVLGGTPWSEIIEQMMQTPDAGRRYAEAARSPAMLHHAERHVQAVLAGCSAQLIRFRRGVIATWLESGKSDFDKARLVAGVLHGDAGRGQATERWLETQERRAAELLGALWPAVEITAATLLALPPACFLDGREAEWEIRRTLTPGVAW